ncbi:MAG: carboxypeptidase regulatory-like domain-containing protein [Bryobacteraceae bacterium]
MKLLQTALVALAMSASLMAQATGAATMLGAVNDTTGAVVPGAKITVINTGTNFVYSSTTTPEGTWYIPNLSPGMYQIKIEASGFKSYVRDGIQLRTGEAPRFDVSLEVGNVTERVEVTGAPPLLETETSTSGQVLEGETIQKIPVLQKAFYRIYLYMPGMNVINGQHAVGQRQRSLGYTIDGVNAKESVLGNPNSIDTVVTATLDMIQEFKMYTTGLPAEFGHSSGGQLNGVFKSGTNQLHGSAEDRYLNGRLVHRQFFEQLVRCQGLQVCNPFSYHEMGATGGGPLYIPKVYNGKDKTFWYGGYQRHHEKVTETYTGTVPTPEMYQGNFSFGGRGFPIYDPASTRQLANGTWTRDPFAGNIIPQARFDPVSKNFIARSPWKQPTDPGSLGSGGPANNLVVPSKGRYYITRVDAKVDHQFSPMNKIYGRFSRVRERIPGRFFSSYELNWELLDPIYFYPLDLTNIVVADNHTFSPTLINEVRFGYNRRHQTLEPPAQNGDWAKQLGIPNVSAETFPDFLNSGGGRFFNAGPGGKSERIGEDFSFQENLTKIVQKHTLKLGYELIRTGYDSLAETFPSGRYFMGGTELPFTPNTGNAFASFLLGGVGSAQFTKAQGLWSPRWFSNSVYFQDDWKPMRNLTLNLGIRWSYETPFKTSSLVSQFNPTAVDPLTGRTGAIVHTPGALAKKDLNNFQPRLGVAYNFRPKWVFRGNFGIITSDLLTSALGNNFEEYLASANIQAPPGDPREVFNLSQGPPSFQFRTNQDGSVPFVGTNYSARGASYWDPNMRNPYVMNWSGGVQYQLTNTWLTEILYQGSAGVGLLNNWDINVLPLNVSSDFATLNTIRTAYQNYRPYTQFGSIQHYSNYGHNTHHGATFRVEKRYASGITLNSFWTWSKTMNDVDEDGGAGGVTWYNRKLEKGRAGYDISHRFVTTFTWELPVGKGRKYMNGGGWKNAVLGGWELVTSQHFMTGNPVTIGFGGSPNFYLPGASRPNQIKPNDQVKSAHVDLGGNRFPFSAQNRYFDYTGFAYPASFTAGSLGRNTLQAPGVVWMQASLAKEWKLFERFKASLRFDANNPYKYHSFNPPNTTFDIANRTGVCPASITLLAGNTCPAAFGTFNGTRGSFSDIGTGRWHGIMVFRVEF